MLFHWGARSARQMVDFLVAANEGCQPLHHIGGSQIRFRCLVRPGPCKVGQVPLLPRAVSDGNPTPPPPPHCSTAANACLTTHLMPGRRQTQETSISVHLGVCPDDAKFNLCKQPCACSHCASVTRPQLMAPAGQSRRRKVQEGADGPRKPASRTVRPLASHCRESTRLANLNHGPHSRQLTCPVRRPHAQVRRLTRPPHAPPPGLLCMAGGPLVHTPCGVPNADIRSHMTLRGTKPPHARKCAIPHIMLHMLLHPRPTTPSLAGRAASSSE